MFRLRKIRGVHCTVGKEVIVQQARGRVCERPSRVLSTRRCAVLIKRMDSTLFRNDKGTASTVFMGMVLPLFLERTEHGVQLTSVAFLTKFYVEDNGPTLNPCGRNAMISELLFVELCVVSAAHMFFSSGKR